MDELAENGGGGGNSRANIAYYGNDPGDGREKCERNVRQIIQIRLKSRGTRLLEFAGVGRGGERGTQTKKKKKKK